MSFHADTVYSFTLLDLLRKKNVSDEHYMNCSILDSNREREKSDFKMTCHGLFKCNVTYTHKIYKSISNPTPNVESVILK